VVEVYVWKCQTAIQLSYDRRREAGLLTRQPGPITRKRRDLPSKSRDGLLPAMDGMDWNVIVQEVKGFCDDANMYARLCRHCRCMSLMVVVVFQFRCVVRRSSLRKASLAGSH
jgi:hypothetical protein